MPLDPADEPPIDLSLQHYMEDQALAIALDKAGAGAMRARVLHLIELQAELKARREAHAQTATRLRHARGEVYSKARVAAINAMGPSRASLDENVRALYRRQADAAGVLAAHARSNFAFAQASGRLSLADTPPDLVPHKRDMLAHEEAFAAAWMAAVDDPALLAEVRQRRRELLVLLRTSTRPMFLSTRPALDVLDDAEAGALGTAWRKLDELCGTVGVKPLSDFIALDDEGEQAGVPARDIVASIEGVLKAVENPKQKFPSRKKTAALLGKLRDALVRLEAMGGRAFFEIDV